MTNEQRESRNNLKALGRYRIEYASDGWPYIPGAYGRLEWDCGFTVYTDHRLMISRLLAISGVKKHQTGDGEARMTLRPDAIPPVLALIKARKRRSPEAAAHLGAHAYRASSGFKNTPVVVGVAS